MGDFQFGGMELFLVFALLVLLLAIVGLVVLVRWIARTLGGNRARGGQSAMDILRQRYARGEIEKAEFEQKRSDLGGGGTTGNTR